MKTFTFYFLAINLVFVNSVNSQTHIPSGYVSGTWTAASSPYIIDGEITLDTFDLLTIEPGVDVEFSGHYKFIVHGRLLAEGTETDSINFYPQDTTTGWHGLRFDYTNLNGQDSSKLFYCRFEYGKAYGEDEDDKRGGAIFCWRSSKLHIKNTIIENDSARSGGAIWLSNSDILMEDIIIQNNRAHHVGGGISAGYCDLDIRRAIIRWNTCINNVGGGIVLECSIDGSSFQLIDAEIYGNYALQSAGGIHLGNYQADLFFTNVNIYNNTSETIGGGLHGIVNFSHVNNVKIHDNNAEDGGGIAVWQSDNALLQRLQVYNNTASNRGGGIIVIGSENVDINQTDVYNNSASTGAGISCILYNETTLTSVDVNSCIIRNNSSGQISLDETSTITVTYSDIENGYEGTGNIDADALFNDPDNGDFSLTWNHDPEPDETKSPCIDSGDPTIPYDPDGTRIDMGAIPYEQTYTPLTAGNISGTLLCSESPYYVYGNLTVPSGEQLVIEPCVHMVFQGHHYLKVQGQLLAQGTESDKITFCAADSATGWSGIRFSGTSTNGQDSSKLENCRMFWGNVGDGGALYLEYSSDILVNDCHIFNNRASDQGGGIYLYYAAPLLINSMIENNLGKYGGGIYGYVGNYQVHGGSIQNNTAEIGGGIYQRGSSPQFHGVTFKDNYATNVGGGIYFYGNCSPLFYPDDRCNFYDNYAVVAGTDLYGNFSAGAHPDIYVDTFTVINPDKHFIYPFDEFTVDMLNGKNTQVAADLYVSPTGDDSNSGTSEAEPLQTIYRALKIILPDPVTERTIHLAPGFYSNSTTNENFPLNMRTDVTLDGWSKILVAFLGDSTTNFFYFFDDQNCKLKNIRFYGGTAGNGGALNIDQYSTPEIDSVSFVYNTASGEGGAIFCDNYSDALISNALFLLNESDGNGGAIACKTGSSPIFIHCSFSDNTGYNGGGLYAKGDAHVSLTNVIFNNNSGRDGGGCWIDYDSDPVLTNVSFINNEATYGSGGGALFSYYSDPVLNNCVFRSNTASHGGGGFAMGAWGTLEMNNSWITGNLAGYGGGVSGGNNSNLILRNVEITNNTTQNTPYVNEEGGGLYLRTVNVSLINVTIADNLTATDGGAIYCRQGSNISIHNGILWNNIPDGINIESGTVTAEYSDIEGGWAGIGNIDDNPDFYDLLSYNYSLNETSPCIDMGTPDTTGLFLPATDLNGNPRIGNGRIDIGAYEYFERMELDLKVFFEGPYNGAGMSTDITGLTDFPLSQPFDGSPWFYSGSENVTTIPGTDIVDWILIELRDAPDAASAIGSTMFSRMAGFLLSDGSVVSIDGSTYPKIFNVVNDQLFTVIRQRNHLGIMSANPVTESGGIYTYDFTTPAGQAYGTDAQKNMGGGVYGLFSGDGNADGTINSDDKTTIWSIEAGTAGYLNGDFNMDSQTDNRDKNDLWINNTSNSSQIPN